MHQFSQPHSAIAPTQAEVLALHQLADDFHQEVELRTAFEQYCQWYTIVAEQHRQEFEQLQREMNLFRLFRREKSGFNP